MNSVAPGPYWTALQVSGGYAADQVFGSSRCAGQPWDNSMNFHKNGNQFYIFQYEL